MGESAGQLSRGAMTASVCKSSSKVPAAAKREGLSEVALERILVVDELGRAATQLL
ncbi:hypothetical protein OG782_36875 [Streptomyces sp. NBC_00876]|uniref:hypothetical protein n=1 Tax=Streptomyces sp. NBC_00876 TaxID=2975853 RepID=UPI00386F4A2A|nr:hypothetical protein OG782_36875 [Streptomyces sp. NBC_00876]